jgi:outer membrane protein OmpA-like peptidoglycan-associated protein
MAWIEVHQSLRDHRKILALADLLDMPEVHVAGHCLYLWLWALDNAADGVLPLSERIIARAAGWTHDPHIFVDALLSTGMIDKNKKGQLRIHDWDDYAGKLADRRERNRLSMRVARERERSTRVQHVDTTSTPRDETSKATVQYPTVPNSTLPLQVTGISKNLLKEVRKEGPSVRPSKEKNPEEDEALRHQKARFTSTQLEDELAKCKNWVARKPDTRRFNSATITSWLRRVKDDDVIPEAETDVQRLTRWLKEQPDEKCLIHGHTVANLKDKLYTAKREEERVAYEARSRMQAQTIETLLVPEEFDTQEPANGKPRDLP